MHSKREKSSMVRFYGSGYKKIRGTALAVPQQSLGAPHLRGFRRCGSFENYILISTGCSSLKLTADSAGRTISLLPVKAAPPAPAPAPTPAPIAAPLPPPAKPPISAPRPAPPPIITAERLPLPLAKWELAAVCT